WSSIWASCRGSSPDPTDSQRPRFACTSGSPWRVSRNCSISCRSFVSDSSTMILGSLLRSEYGHFTEYLAKAQYLLHSEDHGFRRSKAQCLGQGCCVHHPSARGACPSARCHPTRPA